MNILLVTPVFRPKVGGIGRSAERLATSFAAAGHTARVLTYDRNSQLNLAPYTKSELLPGHDLEILRTGPIASNHAEASNEIRATLKRQFIVQSILSLRSGELPDIVLSLGLIDAGFVGLCIAQAIERPHVVSARGTDTCMEIFQGEKFSFAQWVVSRSSAVTFVNRYLFDLASAVFGKHRNYQIINNAVGDPGSIASTEREAHRKKIRNQLGIPIDAKVLGWSGKFRAIKGLVYLDEAFRILVGQRADVYLLIVGGPRYEKERALCPLLDDHGPAGERLRCTGIIEQAASVCAYYAAMDAFVYPSLDDGMSNAVLEAMAFGLPVITTDIFTNIATDGETALMVKRFDAQELASAICRIIDDSSFSAHIAENARKYVLAEFTLTREREAYISLFNKVMEGADGPGSVSS